MARDLGRLYLLFTPDLCAGDPWDTLEQALLGGVDMVQWRVAEPDPAGIARCLYVCRAHEVPVLVNDHVKLAVQLGADGAHVGQQDTPAPNARRKLKDRLFGVSTHNLEQLRAAAEAGADYVVFGPCFHTETKGYEEGLPRKQIAAAAAASEIPLYAIGGIQPRNLPILQDLGIERIAVCSAILRASHVRDAAAHLHQILKRNK